MTETTPTYSTPLQGADGGYAAYTPRSPEVRAAVQALRGLRQDLLHDVLAYRPLARKSADGPLVRNLPHRLRRYAGWAPHAVAAVLAWITLMVSATTVQTPLLALSGLVPAVRCC